MTSASSVPCYNEEGNIEILTDRVRELFANLPRYNYEHIIIDNHSTDRTVEILRGIAKNGWTLGRRGLFG